MNTKREKKLKHKRIENFNDSSIQMNISNTL